VLVNAIPAVQQDGRRGSARILQSSRKDISSRCHLFVKHSLVAVLAWP